MKETNPSLQRAWIQTAGLPIDALTAAVRAAVDQTNTVKVADGAQRVVLFDQHDQPICSMDFHPRHYTRIEEAAQPKAEQPVKVKPGDTVIRRIDAKQAAEIGQARDYFDAAREVPPINLPDFNPYAAGDGNDSMTRTLLTMAAFIAACILLYIAADHFGLLDALDGTSRNFGSR